MRAGRRARRGTILVRGSSAARLWPRPFVAYLAGNCSEGACAAAYTKGFDGRECESEGRVEEAGARGRAVRAGGARALRLLRLARGARGDLVEHLEDRLGLRRHHPARGAALRGEGDRKSVV